LWLVDCVLLCFDQCYVNCDKKGKNTFFCVNILKSLLRKIGNHQLAGKRILVRCPRHMEKINVPPQKEGPVSTPIASTLDHNYTLESSPRTLKRKLDHAVDNLENTRKKLKFSSQKVRVEVLEKTFSGIPCEKIEKLYVLWFYFYFYYQFI
uniref:THAP-type domain-containing protein n=1 Tax=Acanthochromis polyacanthus TaxID=80966 RepID=A0A3Q1GVA9_9TELE